MMTMMTMTTYSFRRLMGRAVILNALLFLLLSLQASCFAGPLLIADENDFGAASTSAEVSSSKPATSLGDLPTEVKAQIARDAANPALFSTSRGFVGLQDEPSVRASLYEKKYGEDAFIQAAKRGDVRAVNGFVHDPKVTPDEIGFALEKAAKKGQLAVVQRLNEEPVVTGEHRAMGLVGAAKKGQLAVVKELENAKGVLHQDRATALIHAVGAGHKEIVEELLKSSLDITPQDIEIAEGWSVGRPEIQQLLQDAADAAGAQKKPRMIIDKVKK